MAKILTNLTLVVTSATTLSLAVSLSPAQAVVLFDNGAPDFEAVIPSDQSSPDFLTEAGDDFTLNNPASITKVTWSGIYLFGSIPLTDNFSVSLFNIVSGVPDSDSFATLIGSLSRVDSGLDVIPDATLYNYALTLTTPFNVGAGNYLLSVVNNTTTDPNDDWAWATSNFLEGQAYDRSSSGDTWRDVPSELSFAIEGDTTPVPTPALLPGLIGLGVGVWRKRNAEA